MNNTNSNENKERTIPSFIKSSPEREAFIQLRSIAQAIEKEFEELESTKKLQQPDEMRLFELTR